MDLTLTNLWRVTSKLALTPTAVSRGSTRGGPRTRDPAVLEWSIGLETDARRALQLRPTLEGSQGKEGVGWRIQAGVEVVARPAGRIEIAAAPTWDRRSVGDQYVGSTNTVPYPETYGRRYLYADLERRDLSMQTRLNWAFTPRSSLQIYMQPLFSSAEVRRYKQLEAPETFRFVGFREGRYDGSGGRAACAGGTTCLAPDGQRHLDFTGDGTSDHTIRDRNFNVRSVRATAVYRWEYRPGSAFLIIWQRRQEGEGPGHPTSMFRHLRALGQLPSDNTLIVKANIWLPF